jgi:hypothetical protein
LIRDDHEMPRMTMPTVLQVEGDDVNEVRIIGRVSRTAYDSLAGGPPAGPRRMFQIAVRRATSPERGPVDRNAVDVLACCAWRAVTSRKVAGLRAGDIVEVRGALRGRLARVGSRLSCPIEIDVDELTVVCRAGSGD